MKKMRYLGIIAIIAVICISMSACAFGGTFEIQNKTDGEIMASAYGITNLTDIVPITISKGESKTWTFDVDTEITWSWYPSSLGGLLGGSSDEKTGKVTISGGAKEVIVAK